MGKSLTYLSFGLVASVVIYAAIVLLVYIFQNKLIFYPKTLKPDYSFSLQTNFEEGFLKSSLGYNINYLVFKPPNPERVILYFHGNAGALDTWGPTAEELSQKTNSEVWILDYPGFGKSGTKLVKSEKELIHIGLEFLKEIKEKQSPNRPIYLYGRSLGSGVASGVADKINVTGLILETPYLSIEDIGKNRYPFIPSSILKIKLNNKILKNSTQSNIIMFHGTNDTVINYDHAVKLHDLIKDKAKFVSFKNGAHSNLSSRPKFWSELQSYLK